MLKLLGQSFILAKTNRQKMSQMWQKISYYLFLFTYYFIIFLFAYFSHFGYHFGDAIQGLNQMLALAFSFGSCCVDSYALSWRMGGRLVGKNGRGTNIRTGEENL